MSEGNPDLRVVVDLGSEGRIFVDDVFGCESKAGGGRPFGPRELNSGAQSGGNLITEQRINSR